MGRIYYYQHYAANVATYPDVAAPDPGPLPAELVTRLKQLDEQARALVPALPAVPAELDWSDFTWHKLPNEPAAEVWLTQL